MSIDKEITIEDKVKGKIGRKTKLSETGEEVELIGKIADTSFSLGEIVERLKKEHNIDVTIPTVTTYLKMTWGKDYGIKKKEMSKRRSLRLLWKVANVLLVDVWSCSYVPYIMKTKTIRRPFVPYSFEESVSMEEVNSNVIKLVNQFVDERIEDVVTNESRKSLEDYAYENRDSLSPEDIPEIVEKFRIQARATLSDEIIEIRKMGERRINKLLYVYTLIEKSNAPWLMEWNGDER